MPAASAGPSPTQRTERAIERALGARAVRRHGLHHAPARHLVPPRVGASRRPLGGGGGAQLRAARAGEAGRPPARPHAPLRPPRRVRAAARPAARRWAAGCSEQTPGSRFVVHVDSNGHVDREAAARAGIAVYGKNTLAITRRHGSWVVLGVLITDAELEPTHAAPEQPAWDACGECRACIDACPTDAIVDDGVLDARRCLSYLSQSRLEQLPFAEAFEDRVYGCDICQDVCPWNRGAERRAETLLEPDAVDDVVPAARRVAGGRPGASWRSATGGCTCPTATAATCSETRGWRWRNVEVSPGSAGGAEQRAAAAPRPRARSRARAAGRAPRPGRGASGSPAPASAASRS